MKVAEMKAKALKQLHDLARQTAKVGQKQGRNTDEYTRARHWVDSQREAYVVIGLMTYVEATREICAGYEDAYTKE